MLHRHFLAILALAKYRTCLPAGQEHPQTHPKTDLYHDPFHLGDISYEDAFDLLDPVDGYYESARLLPTGEVIWRVIPLPEGEDAVIQASRAEFPLQSLAVLRPNGTYFISHDVVEQAVEFARTHDVLIEEPQQGKQEQDTDGAKGGLWWDQDLGVPKAIESATVNNEANTLDINLAEADQQTQDTPPDAVEWIRFNISDGIGDAWGLFKKAVRSIGGVIDGETFETSHEWWFPRQAVNNGELESELRRVAESRTSQLHAKASAQNGGSVDDISNPKALDLVTRTPHYPHVTVGPDQQMLVEDLVIPTTQQGMAQATEELHDALSDIQYDEHDGKYYLNVGGAKQPLEVVYIDHPVEAVGPAYDLEQPMEHSGAENASTVVLQPKGDVMDGKRKHPHDEFR